MLAWDEDLKLAGNALYLDSRVPRASCFVSRVEHALPLSDHADFDELIERVRPKKIYSHHTAIASSPTSCAPRDLMLSSHGRTSNSVCFE